MRVVAERGVLADPGADRARCRRVGRFDADEQEQDGEDRRATGHEHRPELGPATRAGAPEETRDPVGGVRHTAGGRDQAVDEVHPPRRVAAGHPGDADRFRPTAVASADAHPTSSRPFGRRAAPRPADDRARRVRDVAGQPDPGRVRHRRRTVIRADRDRDPGADTRRDARRQHRRRSDRPRDGRRRPGLPARHRHRRRRDGPDLRGRAGRNGAHRGRRHAAAGAVPRHRREHQQRRRTGPPRDRVPPALHRRSARLRRLHGHRRQHGGLVLRGRPRRRRRGSRQRARDPAGRAALLQPQRRLARVRPRWDALHRARGWRLGRRPAGQRAAARHVAGQGPAHRCRRRGGRRGPLHDPRRQPVRGRRERRAARDLGVGPAQPVAVPVRRARPATCGSATSDRARGRRSTSSGRGPRARTSAGT